MCVFIMRNYASYNFSFPFESDRNIYVLRKKCIEKISDIIFLFMRKINFFAMIGAIEHSTAKH